MNAIFATHTGGWIGDMILLSPALTALRRAFPAARIVLQTRPLVKAMMERHPDVDEVLAREDSPAERGLSGLRRQARELRSRGFDAAVVWHPTSVRSAVLPWMAGIPIRAGHRIAGRGAFLTRSIPNAFPHETIRYLRILPLLGLPESVVNDARTAFWHTDDDRAFAETFLRERGFRGDAPLVGFHLGATWDTKRWRVERFAETARALTETGAAILLTGAASDAPLRGEFARALGGAPFLDAAGACDLFQSAALIERCDAFVTADSGPMHLAAAVGTRVVALFGPTSPDRHGPVGAGHAILRDPPPCAPCYRRRCRLREQFLCMERLHPLPAVLAARQVIGQAGGQAIERR